MFFLEGAVRGPDGIQRTLVWESTDRPYGLEGDVGTSREASEVPEEAGSACSTGG